MFEPEAADSFILHTVEDARSLEERIHRSASAACIALSELMSEHPPLGVLRALKFGEIGYKPFDPGRRVNFLEQVHQTFRHLVTLRAAEYLLQEHPAHAPFSLSIGGTARHDVESIDGKVIAETVAVLSANDNNKIRFDLERARESDARHRYLFYTAEDGDHALTDSQVRVVPLST